MVAIFKLIISAALLSQASAAALPVSVSTTVKAVPTSVVQVVNGNVLAVGDPVLAVRPAKISSKVRVSRATSAVADVASPTAPLVSVEATGILGKLIVGEPVLAVRPTAVVTKVAGAVPTNTLVTSVLKAVPTLVA